MLRSEISTALKEAMKAKAEIETATLRLILAALKDRDIAARSKGVSEPIDEEEILELLQKMVRQRREAIDLYVKGGRQDLADREAAEIQIIQRFLPKPLSDADVESAVAAVIDELEASSIKDMGRVMTALKERYAGRMDFGKAGNEVKKNLMKAG